MMRRGEVWLLPFPTPTLRFPERYPPTLFRVRQHFGSREQWQPLTYRHRVCDPRIFRRRLPLLSTTGQDPTFHGLSPCSKQVTVVQSISCSLSIGAKKALLATESTASFGFPDENGNSCRRTDRQAYPFAYSSRDLN
jgi:hypothetical protein